MVQNAPVERVITHHSCTTVKRPAADVVECYRTFIRALLDLTDNIVGGEVVPPPDVVRYDGDDPYLVSEAVSKALEGIDPLSVEDVSPVQTPFRSQAHRRHT